jgi:hypothetical protein
VADAPSGSSLIPLPLKKNADEEQVLRYNAVYFEDSPEFRRNKSPPSSGLKSKSNEKLAETGGRLTYVSDEFLFSPLSFPPPYAGFMVHSPFYTEYDGDMLFRNVGSSPKQKELQKAVPL